ncbi:polysaccharide deacetylase family protein [Streptosporangium lutulentum]
MPPASSAVSACSTREAATIRSAAARSAVGGPADDSVPNTCTDRVALTFDDGPSFYRAQTLAILREKQVTATFFDVGMRIDANPRLPAFERREGHLVLNHTYEHPNLNQVTVPRLQTEMRTTEEALDRAGVKRPFVGMRPPFLAANAPVRAELERLGFTVISGDIDAADWLPDRPPNSCGPTSPMASPRDGGTSSCTTAPSTPSPGRS